MLENEIKPHLFVRPQRLWARSEYQSKQFRDVQEEVLRTSRRHELQEQLPETSEGLQGPYAFLFQNLSVLLPLVFVVCGLIEHLRSNIRSLIALSSELRDEPNEPDQPPVVLKVPLAGHRHYGGWECVLVTWRCSLHLAAHLALHAGVRIDMHCAGHSSARTRT